MGLVRDRWKFSFRRSSSSFSFSPESPPQLPSSPPSSPPSSATKSTDPPPEFICPISGALMADPVIIPSGETFERACIEACRDLSVSPPSLPLDISSSLLLIPNSALRSAILRWCDIAGVARPLPISSDAARFLVDRLLSSSNSKAPTNCSTELPNENSPPTTFSSSSSHSSSSSSEIISPKTPNHQTPETPLPADPLEEKIQAKLKHSQIQEQESALNSLLEATRESASRRVALSSPRLLVALRGLLLSRHASVKTTVLAVIVNLSLEPANKVRIVRSGAVPAIVETLHSSSLTAAREHAAGALFSLALEEQNRTAIGVLGAVPPLLRLFCSCEDGLRARLEAGMALHYLGLAEMNMAKLARVAGAVKGLVAVAKGVDTELRRLAMRIMIGMTENKEGRAAMLDGGAVEAMVAFLRKVEDEEQKEMIVTILYGMSMAGLRFRGIARRAGAEEVLETAAEGLDGERREMVRMALRVISGEAERERDVDMILWAEEEDDERSAASETLVASRRNNRLLDGGSGPNSAGF